LTLAAISVAAAAVAVMNLGSRPSDAQPLSAPSAPDAMKGLSVMAYNIEGLPWPLAPDRSAAFSGIEERLRDLRLRGQQPQVLVLEEAFTPGARAVGRASGYRSVAVGKGGMAFGSGLEIATELPILGVKRFTYRDCAGFDCLAAKGALLATIGLAKGVQLQIAATHLNSHKASGSDDSHANQAYFAQVDELSRFILANRDPKLPLLVVGDFNTYPPTRRAYLARESQLWRADDALDRMGVNVWRGKDRQFFASGGSVSVKPLGITIPFGREADGTMISNHVGYAIHYRLDPGAGAFARG
jgi:hypothetical protein